MEIFLIGVLAGVVFIAIHKSNKRNESRYAAGKDARKCPHCLEYIKAHAIVCRYCQRDVPMAETPEPARRSYRAEYEILWALGAFIVIGVVVGFVVTHWP